MITLIGKCTSSTDDRFARESISLKMSNVYQLKLTSKTIKNVLMMQNTLISIFFLLLSCQWAAFEIFLATIMAF